MMQTMVSPQWRSCSQDPFRHLCLAFSSWCPFSLRRPSMVPKFFEPEFFLLWRLDVIGKKINLLALVGFHNYIGAHLIKLSSPLTSPLLFLFATPATRA